MKALRKAVCCEETMVAMMVDTWVWWKVAVKAAKMVEWTESRRDTSKAAWMGVTMVWTQADGTASYWAVDWGIAMVALKVEMTVRSSAYSMVVRMDENAVERME